MDTRKEILFLSDVHLGLALHNPEDRENRFVNFLKSVPRDRVKTIFLLGDIWDFWYEYRDVIPNYAPRVIAQFINLIDDGIEIYYCPGNHDLWAKDFFKKIGIKMINQPYFFESEGKKFCVGHGHLLGGAKFRYKMMLNMFDCKPLQALYSTLHPWLAFRIGLKWSNSKRRIFKPYDFKDEEEPLYKYCKSIAEKQKVDYFVFGHFHVGKICPLSDSSTLYVLKDWVEYSHPHAIFNGTSFEPHFEEPLL